MFLREQSLPLPLAQRVAERHGPQTVARVQQDPYVALAGFGLPFRWAQWVWRADVVVGKAAGVLAGVADCECAGIKAKPITLAPAQTTCFNAPAPFSGLQQGGPAGCQGGC